MSLMNEFRELLKDHGEVIPEVPKAAIEEILEENPLLEVLGREEFVYLPKADYMSALMMDTMREMMRIRDRKSDTASWTYRELRKQISDRLPWLVPHFPQWLKDEHPGGMVTDAAYAVLMYELATISFLNPTIKADYVIDRDKAVTWQADRTLELYITTPSGQGMVLVRPGQRGVKRLKEGGYEIQISRAELTGSARKDYPRSAVTFTLQLDEHGTSYVTSSHSTVTGSVTGSLD